MHSRHRSAEAFSRLPFDHLVFTGSTSIGRTVAQAAAEGLVPMHKFQRVYVDYALRRFGGNKVHTAAALGIDRRTIQRWARARADYTPAPTAQITSTTSS